MRPTFTVQELADLSAVDAEIERGFRLTRDEARLSRELDRVARLELMMPEQRRKTESRRAWEQKHCEARRAYQAAYYQLHRDEKLRRANARNEERRKQRRAELEKFAREIAAGILSEERREVTIAVKEVQRRIVVSG